MQPSPDVAFWEEFYFEIKILFQSKRKKMLARYHKTNINFNYVLAIDGKNTNSSYYNWQSIQTGIPKNVQFLQAQALIYLFHK